MSASNLALAAGAANPLAFAVGIASGAYIYSKASERIQPNAAPADGLAAK